MADRLIALFAEVLGVPEHLLTSASSPDTVPEWDSHATLRLVAEIEDTFEVELTTSEIMRMRTIGIAREVLRRKDVPEL
jgi:acyl carrier protein